MGTPVNISRTPVMPFATSSGKENLRRADMHVHVPQAGDQKFSGPVDLFGAFFDLDLFLNRGDLPVLDATDIPGRASAPVASITVTFLNNGLCGRLRRADQRKKKQFHLEQFLNGRLDVLHRRLSEKGFRQLSRTVVNKHRRHFARPLGIHQRCKTCRRPRLSSNRTARPRHFASALDRLLLLLPAASCRNGDEIESPRARSFSASFTSCGISARQGTHQVAQKSTRTILPLCVATIFGKDASVTGVNFGCATRNPATNNIPRARRITFSPACQPSDFESRSSGCRRR